MSNPYLTASLSAMQKYHEARAAERRREDAIVVPEEFDAETRKLMAAYAGHDFDKPRRVIAEAFSEWSSERWSLSDFRALVDKAVAEAGSSLEEAEVLLVGDGYDEGVSLKITYPRMETDEEVATRVRRAYIYAHNKQAEERATFERLKQKYAASNNSTEAKE